MNARLRVTLAIALLGSAFLALAASSEPSRPVEPVRASAGPARGPDQVAQADSPGALDFVPATAPIVVVVPSLQDLSDRLAAMAEATGIDAVPYNDLLGALTGELGITAGLRADGPLVAWLDPFNPAASGPVVVLPVADYAAFVGGFGVTGAPGATAVLPTPIGPLTHVRQVGDFAVLGTQAAQVEAVQLPPASSLTSAVGTLGLAAARSGQLSLVVNVETLAPFLVPIVNQMWATWEGLLETPGDPSAQSSFEAFLNAYRYIIGLLLTETQTTLISVDLEPTFAAFDWSWQFKPGSTLASAFPSGAPVGDRLAALPTQPYFLVLAANLEGLNLTPLFDGMAEAFPADSSWSTLMGGAIALGRDMRGLGTGWYAPAPGTAEDTGGFDVFGFYETTDAAAYTQQMRQYLEALSGVELPAGPGVEPGSTMGTLSYDVTYSTDALDLDGLPVDTYHVHMRLPEGYPAMPFSDYGGYLTAVDATRVVMTTSENEPLLRAGIATVRAGGGLGADGGLDALRRTAFTEPISFEMFIDVGRCATGLGQVMGEMGLGALPLEPPADLDQAAVFGHVIDGGAAARTVLPYTVLRYFIQLGEAAEADTTPI